MLKKTTHGQILTYSKSSLNVSDKVKRHDMNISYFWRNSLTTFRNEKNWETWRERFIFLEEFIQIIDHLPKIKAGQIIVPLCNEKVALKEGWPLLRGIILI